MKFTTKELIKNIIESELTEDEKIAMLNNIMTKGRINDKVYLKQDNEGNLECCIKDEDESTNYSVEEVVDIASHKTR